MKKFLQENLKSILILIVFTIVINIELPYYIEAPGGTINLSKRIDDNYKRENGSLNMLYVTEYKGNIVTIPLSKIIKTWDLYEISNQQISDEDSKDIYNRNRIMLDNSIQNATFVAYNYAGKKINIKGKENIVIATTKTNGLEIGDLILSIDDIPVEDINTIKTYIEKLNPHDKIKIHIKRNKKEKDVIVTLDDDKLIGILMVTNYDYSLEDIMGESFGRYAKTIIQDRALPDVRDGLKPVQRRILYAMYKDGNTYDKPTKKSAKAVGNIMGFYHPHGDSSIYDALVRMSQWWKNNLCYVEMQGNNGSMDGDSAAAMRYTEARLSKVAGELLKDINKETVLMSWNYDDTLLEPTVLPAKYPNLLVNGSTGISAGYATNIPPHNLGEVIDATIKRIDSPNCHLDTILDIIKGPDFPTGGVAEGKKGIKEAFKSGKGKVNIRCKYTIEGTKNKRQIIITEIPYEVNKSQLVK